ncbi:MAG TPA: hypothetical protein VI306_02985 [Pyrinomonadaceae bacterium]
MMKLSNHLTFEQLTDLAEQRELQTSLDSSHLTSCHECTETLEQLQHTFSLMRTDTDKDAPRDVLFQAINVFQPARKVSLARRILAVLSFDSLTAEPAFGTRSGSTDVRQLIFTAEENDIDLHISSTDNKWIISGQLLSEGCKDGEVAIEGENISLSTKINEACEFKLPAVPSGDYTLRLRLSDIEVEVPRLELRK